MFTKFARVAPSPSSSCRVLPPYRCRCVCDRNGCCGGRANDVQVYEEGMGKCPGFGGPLAGFGSPCFVSASAVLPSCGSAPLGPFFMGAV